VLASDGSVLGFLGAEDRLPVPYDAIPKVLVDAVVAAEDHSFWSNPGVDLRGVTRALLADVSAGGITQGGSTITEQLIKVTVLDPAHDAGKKVAEALLALRAAKQMSKRAIITDYLNAVYFGEDAYGVRAAVSRFFPAAPGSPAPGLALADLSLPQAALLAGLIASPTDYDPFTHPQLAKARRSYVLDQMVANGDVTRDQGDDAAAAPLPTAPVPSLLGVGSSVMAEIQQQLLADPRLGATVAERRTLVNGGGLTVTTTIDPAAQQHALDAIRDVLPDQPPFTAALVAVDPATGYVRAAADGEDFGQLQYDLVATPPGRQPGSTYKVITLAAALEAGYSPDDVVDGTSPCSVTSPGLPEWDTENAEPGGGLLTLRDATAGSVNCAYAHVIASLGPPAVVDMAHQLGVTQPVPDYLPITLGVSDTTPLEMATVAATLADEGVRHTPTFVTRVTASDGTVLVDDSQPQSTRAVDADVVDCETDILHDVIQYGTGTAAQLADGRPAAGKTGTTDDHGDAWFLGYTPQLATVVWMGSPQSRDPMTDVGGIEVFGGTYPAEMWREFMDAQLASAPVVPLPDPGPVCERAGSTITDAGRGVAPLPPPVVPTPDAAPAGPDDGTDAPTSPPAVTPTPTEAAPGTDPTPSTISPQGAPPSTHGT
jgi:penicillin-binding protein 1A